MRIMKINRENLLISIIVIGALVWAIWQSYNRFYVQRDYLISEHVSCDPEAENCFVVECDPETEECTGNPEEDTEYYKIIEKSAASVTDCVNPADCPELSCEPKEVNCAIILCSQEEAESEGVICSNNLPEAYSKAAGEEGPESTTEETEASETAPAAVTPE